MQIKDTIFRAYDVRGVYPDELNDEVAYRITRTLVEFYPHVQKMVVACDPRISSPALKKAVVKGFFDSGKEVIDIGIAPDPLFYFSLLHYDYDGGIMISGSHNPKEYNGLTLNVRRRKGKEPEDVIQEDLEKVKERIKQEKGFQNGKGKITKFNPEQDYINYVSERINLKRPLKVIIDSANGACGLLPEKVFERLGCDVLTIFADYDGAFPNHLPDPYEDENLEDIKKAVLEEKADIGFAFDTDGDRVGPIDNKGRRITGDHCLLMLARQALQKKKGPIAHCMRVPQYFLDDMKQKGVNTYFSVSHHEAVRKRIVEKKAVFGGEITYHFLFPLDYYLCDEAVFSSLKLAEIASEHPDFASFIDALPKANASPEVFIETPDEEKANLIKKLQDYLRKGNYNFIDVDGARVNFENGWALARMSNTTPFIKCRFEGKTKQDLEEVERKALAILEEVGIPVKEKHYQELGLNK